MTLKKLLITGGSGFIGTNLIASIEDGLFNILNIDIIEPKIPSLKGSFRKVNINHKKSLKDVFVSFKPEIVIHLAARTYIEEKKDVEEYSSNIQGVENLIELCNDSNSVERVIFTSTMFVCKNGYDPKHDQDFRPDTVYGQSKVLGEKLVREKSSDRYTWCIIRPTSIWGPWFAAPYKNFFDIVISRKYFHPGDRSCTKTYGYIGNVVVQIKSLLEASKNDIHEKVFYVGDKPGTHIGEWADEIADELGIRIKRLPFWFFQLLAMFGDLLNFLKIPFPMTSFRLRNMTTDSVRNLDPIYDLCPELPYSRKEGIRKTLRWMEDQKNLDENS